MSNLESNDQSPERTSNIIDFRGRILDATEAKPEIGVQIAMLQKMRQKIEAGWLQEKDWGQIRQKFYFTMKNIGDPALIMRVVGTQALMRYFSSLSGPDKPYKFYLTLREEDILEYLHYELDNDFVLSAIEKNNLSPAAVNAFVSYCTHVPSWTLNLTKILGGDTPGHLQEFAKKKDLKALNQVLHPFLFGIITAYPSIIPVLFKIFNLERIELLNQLSTYPMGTAPLSLIEKQQKLDQKFFKPEAANDGNYDQLAKAA